jgi:hypothetical protein
MNSKGLVAGILAFIVSLIAFGPSMIGPVGGGLIGPVHGGMGGPEVLVGSLANGRKDRTQ